jgi:hypothetical protein
VNCVECGEQISEGAVIITRSNGSEEWRVHAGVCAESVKRKLKGNVVVQEVTKADIERYKAIHAKFVKTMKDT